jgi:hypothetical protein
VVRQIPLLVIALAWLAVPAQSAAQGDLERARQLYNAGNFDAVVAMTPPARGGAAAASSFALISARARLERFRQTGSQQDLDAARAALVRLNPQHFSRVEVVEWQVGLGETLYLENQLGPASEWFQALMPSVRAQLPPAEIERLLEWWATATSRLAESLTGDARVEKYRELLKVMELELERDLFSRPASYWMVAAARGAGDLNRAWNAGVAGWVRAAGIARGKELRSSIEQLMLQTIIPERAQLRTGQRLDSRPTTTEIADLTEEWRAIVRRWGAGE